MIGMFAFTKEARSSDFCFTEASIQLSTFFCFGPAETRREVDNKSDTII